MQEDYVERLERPEMTYYRDVYKNSKRWAGEPLEGKTLVIYCEQGLGDTVQFARYFDYFKDLKDTSVILHCPKALHRLLLLGGGETCHFGAIDKDDPNLPDHDYHVPSMSLPFVLKDYKGKMPYLSAPPADLGPEFVGVKKIGICWEGSPEHPKNDERSCPLRLFKALAKPGRKLFMLQREIQEPKFTAGAGDLDLHSIPVEDFWDLARLVAAMDIVVSVDTGVLHLAGAMGKMSFGLLAKDYDYRWKVRNWYPTVALLFQGRKGDWLPVFAGAMMMIDTICQSEEKMKPLEVANMLGQSFLS